METGKVLFHPEATEEYVSSFIWYFEKGRHIAELFERETERAVRLIEEAPQRWPCYLKNYRKFPVRRFPYSVVYVTVGDKIFVLAVAHGRRKPGYWKHRVKV